MDRPHSAERRTGQSMPATGFDVMNWARKEDDMTERPNVAHRPRLVIVGAGFGGLTAAKSLADAPIDITVIDQHNHHLFQPLLYQVATAALSPADIASPIRAILHGQRNASVMLAKVTGIDVAKREVLSGDRRVPFDYLILATGAQHAYFGHEDWSAYAKGIKTIDDATALRSGSCLPSRGPRSKQIRANGLACSTSSSSAAARQA